jgi:histidyl-tRNA synthetase
MEIPYRVVPRLVRGLDYYVRTAFEIISGELGAQNALVGGGRYDGLSEVIGGPPVQGFGFAMGLDRLIMLLPESLTSEWRWRPDLFLAYMGEAAFLMAMKMARGLRHEGYRCYLDFSSSSLKSQFRLANKIDARNIVVIGDDEIAKGVYPVKRLSDSQQFELNWEQIKAYLQNEKTR